MIYIRVAVALCIAVVSCIFPGVVTAAERAPAAGVITVSSVADTNLTDNFITLREALLIANGGITGPFTAAEQTFLAGCTINGSGFITGGCGAGTVDTIQFTPTLGIAPVITITAALPAINDSAQTNLNGAAFGVYPIINAVSAGFNADGLVISSSNNTIYGVTIVAAPRDGIRITGNSNTIDFDTTVRANTRHGILIDGGDSNVIRNALIGTKGAICAGNGDTGIVLANGAVGNVVQDSVIGCNANGVIVTNSGSNTNQIGANNYIGMSQGGINLGNTNHGVRISAGAQLNRVLTSTIAYNGTGVMIQDSGTNNTSVRGNRIFINGSGIAVHGGAQLTFIGSALGGGYGQGNLISLNTSYGIYISDTNTSNTFIYGNRIGTSSDGMAMAGNGSAGVYVLRAQNTFIGATPTERNVISGNGSGGVWIRGGKDSLVQGNYIGTDQSGASALPNAGGVILSDGAQFNTIGGNSINNLNVIAGNTGDGVSIYGSATSTNTVLQNDIGINTFASGVPLARSSRSPAADVIIPNTGNGIAFTSGARQNTIRLGNFIAHNNLSGIYLASEAQSNTIGDSAIYSNTQHGVLLIGANTSFNVITRTEIFQNSLDGIGEGGGAAANIWREVRIYDNGGLGINQDSAYPLPAVPNPPANFRITSVNNTSGVVTGKADASVLVVFAFVDLYRIKLDPSGHGEGYSFVGSAATDSNGNWTITDTSPSISNGCYTAVVRGVVIALPYATEFTRSNCAVFAPQVQR